MKTATGTPAAWAGTRLLSPLRRAEVVVVIAGIDNSEIVDAALADTALTNVVLPRFEPACSPPCDALLWRLETASGSSLNQPGMVARYWHRPPYALTLRLVQYQPNSMVPEIMDEGTLSTRGSFIQFKAAVDRLAMRFVRDTALGLGRGPAETMAAPMPAKSLPGWLDAVIEKWHGRLTTELWSIGSARAALDRVLLGGDLGEIAWYRTGDRHHYIADPFPWFGTGRILCEEMPLTDGVGRIIAVAESGESVVPTAVLLNDGYHHSYPCTLRDGDTVFCVPEAPQRGATQIYRLEENGCMAPVCDVAPYLRLADPTLFRWNGRYWLACTDLDLGSHDNLCLLHAPAVTGPFTPHARWPVKIDIRGARPAGMLLDFDGRLFRPGQDCAATYGAAVAIHEVLTLTETDFREVPVAELRPDKSGPFPHGLHTLVHDGSRFWVDGKRFAFDPGLLRQKLLRRVMRVFSGRGMG